MNAAHTTLGEGDELLVGRDNELVLLHQFIHRGRINGDALLLVGDPGVGKTVLLSAAKSAASQAGMRVLHAAGVEFEADVTFSGLNLALLPLLDEIRHLAPLHRSALNVALGLGEGEAPEQLVVSNATLALLRHVALSGPLLMVIDDVHWLDRTSAAVLAFVARRVAGSPVSFLAAVRSGTDGSFAHIGVPEIELGPLDDQSAVSLLQRRFPTLAPPVGERVVIEAAGNPLALLELPMALSAGQRDAASSLPAVLPLTRRLEGLFTSRIANLPARSRELLLLAALDGTGDLRVLHASGPRERGLEDLGPAEQAQLAFVDSGRLTFRHPLVRAAVVSLSTGEERRRAHGRLADLLSDQTDRRTWHLAAATTEPHEDIASLLESLAQRILKRGDGAGAVTALLGAADLSPARSDRGRRLASAAFVGARVAGDLRGVGKMLEEAERADPTMTQSLEAAMAAAYLLLERQGDLDAAHRLLTKAIEAHQVESAAPDDLLIEAIFTLLLACHSGGRPELWEPFSKAVARLGPDAPEVLALCDQLHPDPARASNSALTRLDDAVQALDDVTSPTHIVRLGYAAMYVDRLGGCRGAYWRVVHAGRAGGSMTCALSALIGLATDDYLIGQWNEADELLDEYLRLSEAHSFAVVWPAQYLQALLAAARGDAKRTTELTDEITQWAGSRGMRAVHWHCAHARAVAALGQGDYEYAYHQATLVSPPGTFPPYVQHALWVAMDLVEAAVHIGRREAAQAHVAAMRELGIANLSSRMALVAGGSEAIVASELEATDLFERALALPGAGRWTFDVARIQLAYGIHLRRTHAITEARQHLTNAHDTFVPLGAEPWAIRAGNELRATGIARPSHAKSGTQSLTAQEREIAGLAAAGLSNKHIGERLIMSPRTVSSHLYRIFPKLGVTSRAALRDALASELSDELG